MLIVAVNKYPGENALLLPVKDASDFHRQMSRVANPPPGKQRLYEHLAVKMLLDEGATQQNIREGLKWLRDNVKEKDAGVIFLAGHGMSQENSYYYVPYRRSDIGRQVKLGCRRRNCRYPAKPARTGDVLPRYLPLRGAGQSGECGGDGKSGQ